MISVRGKCKFNDQIVYNDMDNGVLISVNEKDGTTIVHDGVTYPVLIAGNLARGGMSYEWLSPLEKRYALLGTYWIGQKQGIPVFEAGTNTFDDVFKVYKIDRIYTYEQFKMYIAEQESEFQSKVEADTKKRTVNAHS